MHWISQLSSFHVRLKVEIVQPWIDMLVYFIDKKRITPGSMKVESNLKLIDGMLVFLKDMMCKVHDS